MSISIILSILSCCLSGAALAFLILQARKQKCREASLLSRMNQLEASLETEISVVHRRIDESLSELNPNFERAKAAMAQVNDMGATLANLFSYDPVAVLRANRERQGE